MGEYTWTGKGDGKTFYDAKNWEPEPPKETTERWKKLYEQSQKRDASMEAE